jgi:conjugal transfer pilus assembly protein TraW
MVTVRAAALIGMLWSAVAFAQASGPQETPVAAPTSDASVDGILKRSADAVKHPEAVAGSGWQEHADALVKEQSEKNGKELQQLQQGQQDIVRKALNDASHEYNLPSIAAKDEKDVAVHYRIYASQSMGEGGLRQVMTIAAQHPDLVVSFRGMKPGQTLRDMFDSLAKILHLVSAEGQPIAAMEVNPPVFTAAKVDEAPTLEKLDAKGNQIAIVRGVTDPDWIDKQVKDGKKGDLGKRGEVFPVVEEDMLVKLQAAAKQFDYKKWADKAGQDYWQHAPLVELPAATQARQRTIDPTIEVKEDIVTPDEKFIAHKGERFNPLHDIGFHQTVVVFDGTDKAQVEFAKKFIAAHSQDKVTLITTAVDREHGWDGYQAMQDQLGRAVYLLNELFQNTFHIEHVPSLISAKDERFVVTEVPVHQGGAGNVAVNASSR